jgi:hypothetical protein
MGSLTVNIAPPYISFRRFEQPDRQAPKPEKKRAKTALRTRTIGNRDYIDLPDIVFPANETSSFTDKSPAENFLYMKDISLIALDHLEEIKYLHIEGYAYPDKAAMAKEDQNILISPFSFQSKLYQKHPCPHGRAGRKIITHGMGGIN